MSRGLGKTQEAILEVLKSGEITLADLTKRVYPDSGISWKDSEPEYSATSRAVKKLERSGRAKMRWSYYFDRTKRPIACKKVKLVKS